MDEIGVAGRARMADGQEALGLLEQLAVGVEHPVHPAHVAGAEHRVEHRRIAVVPVVARVEAMVVRDVPSRLFEVGHQPAPLEHLGQQVGALLARQMDTAELGHRIVPVLVEDPLVELDRAPHPDGRVDRGVAADVELVDELVEEQPPEALRRARVACEQGALDHFRQVDQGKHRPVEIGDVPAEHVLLLSGEGLDGIGEHAPLTLRRG